VNDWVKSIQITKCIALKLDTGERKHKMIMALNTYLLTYSQKHLISTLRSLHLN